MIKSSIISIMVGSFIYYNLATIDEIQKIKKRNGLGKRSFFTIWHTFRPSFIKKILNAKTVNERRDILEELIILKYKTSKGSQVIYKKNLTDILPTNIDVLLTTAACFIAFTSSSSSTMTQKIVATELKQVEGYTNIREIVFDGGKSASKY